jgi:hypothetical protein
VGATVCLLFRPLLMWPPCVLDPSSVNSYMSWGTCVWDQLSSECSGSFLKKIMPVSALALHAVGMKGAVFDSPITRESATIAIYCSFRGNLYLNSLAARSHDCCFEPGKAFDLLNFQPA